MSNKTVRKKRPKTSQKTASKKRPIFQKSKVELLAPAGSFEKLQYALHYGADAVYLGVPNFSLRYRINDFDEKGLKKAVSYVHEKGKKIYVTANIYAHDIHISGLIKHLKKLNKLGVDGIIVSDPGVVSLAAKHAPKIPIHLSTQANTTNWVAAEFWAKQGVRRIILAREVTLGEIREMRKKLPKKIELEYFVHGAMCMSYSGRCILSKWMTGRSANLGDCAQPCRWKYQTSSKFKVQSEKLLEMTVEDDMKKIEMDLEEDQHGTYFFNSKDLNLLGHLKDLRDAGIESFKIEGRNKSVYYLSVVVKAYRKVWDAVETGDKKLLAKVYREQKKELDDLVHRGYTTGFLLGNEPEHDFKASHKPSHYEFVGQVVDCKDNIIEVKPHNAIRMNDQLEIISKDKSQKIKLKEIRNEKGEICESAHGGQGKNYFFKIDKKNIERMSLLRRQA